MTVFTGNDEKALIKQAEKQFGVSQDRLVVRILQTARRGFLGIGKRPAKLEITKRIVKESSVRKPADDQQTVTIHKEAQESKEQPNLTPADTYQQEMAKNHQRNVAKLKEAIPGLQNYLVAIYQQLGVEVEPQLREVKVHHCEIDLHTDHPGQVVGYHGRRLNAIEQLGVAYLNYHGVREIELVLNTGEYREKRQATLDKVMERSITQVIATGQAVFLDPMPARERKYLHQLAQQHPQVRTYSHGRDPFRSVVIAPQN
ncbi:RNA-binding cell elongation regulator Jag/EloR [uncultured Limosilactobacillus sp.]|uniref:RNA-binding cell elongation regulator Jag/EloR n=1 Tax=uncultured Limosilactobacillus sp. TaxID=2837629 RepID=UPI0025D5DC95|nr:RNA-binding cell elongation regulator Jag/EloR [uncultured Limosilactobacillus sp.]